MKAIPVNIFDCARAGNSVLIGLLQKKSHARRANRNTIIISSMSPDGMRGWRGDGGRMRGGCRAADKWREKVRVRVK